METESHRAEAEYLKQLDPTIVELAKQIGRSGGMNHVVSGKFQSASRSDISGVTIGNDLNCLLPVRTCPFRSKIYGKPVLPAICSESSSTVFISITLI